MTRRGCPHGKFRGKRDSKCSVVVAEGERGARRTLVLLAAEMRIVTTLAGCRTPDVGRDLVAEAVLCNL